MPGMSELDPEQILGEEHVTRDSGARIDGVPVEWTLRPGSPEEVARCLAGACQAGRAVVAFGAGTKQMGLNPLAAPVVWKIELRRLDRIVELDADEGVVVAQAGVPVAALDAAARSVGKRLGFGTAGPPAATLGGTYSADPLVPEVSVERRSSYEALGVQVALCDGSLARAGGRVVKNVTGFDLVRLYFGSFGTLGIVTELALRLRPEPEVRQVHDLGLSDLAAAISQGHRLGLVSPLPDGVVALPGGAGGATLRVLLEGSEADVAARAAKVGGESRPESAWAALAEPLWRAPAPGATRLRISGLTSDAGEIRAAIAKRAGDESLRLTFPAAGIALAEVADAGSVEDLWQLAAQQGWAFRMEDAPREQRLRLDAFGSEPPALPLMRALKQRFDPGRNLAPGRFVGRL